MRITTRNGDDPLAPAIVKEVVDDLSDPPVVVDRQSLIQFVVNYRAAVIRATNRPPGVDDETYVAMLEALQ